MRLEANDAEPRRRGGRPRRPSAQGGEIAVARANDAIRAGLRGERETASLRRYVPTVFKSGEPLIDVRDVSEALEALERAD
jgi:hypothetical protein